MTHSVEPAPLAYNNSFGEACPAGTRGFSRPANVRFGPKGRAYIADCGAGPRFGTVRSGCRFHELRRCGAAADPRYRDDLEDLPAVRETGSVRPELEAPWP